MTSVTDVTSDSLVDALYQLTLYFNCKIDITTLMAGLPLSDGKLMPSEFPRAAERAGLEAHLCQCSISSLSDQQCPAVLLLTDDRVEILLSIDNQKQQVQLLSTQSEKHYLSFKEIERLSTGYIISVCSSGETGFGQIPEAEAKKTISESGHRWFWSVAGRFWRTYCDVLVASFLINLFALASPLFVMNVYDRVVPNQAYETLWLLAIGVGIAMTFDFIIKMVRAHYVDLAGRKIDITLSAGLMEKVLGLKLFARPASTGNLINSLSEFDSIRNFLTSASVLALIDLPFVLLFLGLIGWIAPSLVVIPLVCMMMAGFVALLVNSPLQRQIQASQKVSSERQSFLVEALMGLVTIKSSSVESYQQFRWERMTAFLADKGLTIRRLQFISNQAAAYILQLGTVLLVVSGVYLIGLGELSMGGLIATMMIAGRCTAPVVQAIGLLNAWQRAKQGLELGREIMRLPQERPAGKRFLKPENLKGHWKFHQVSFAYPGAPMLLKQVTLEISSGSKVAVLGRMGSGKSTLLQLMIGLWEPSEGAVTINGIDVRQVDPLILRSHIGYVPQRIELYNGTLRDNIVMGHQTVSDSQVIEAARQAGLDTFLTQHEAGLDFIVGENGRNLSGGQAQSLGVARALLHKPSILIFDEPTSSMDSSAEQAFIQMITELTDCTVIIVTHKQSLVKVMNHVMVMDQGKLVGNGSPDDVLGVHSSVQSSSVQSYNVQSRNVQSKEAV